MLGGRSERQVSAAHAGLNHALPRQQVRLDGLLPRGQQIPLGAQRVRWRKRGTELLYCEGEIWRRPLLIANSRAARAEGGDAIRPASTQAGQTQAQDKVVLWTSRVCVLSLFRHQKTGLSPLLPHTDPMNKPPPTAPGCVVLLGSTATPSLLPAPLPTLTQDWWVRDPFPGWVLVVQHRPNLLLSTHLNSSPALHNTKSPF